MTSSKKSNEISTTKVKKRDGRLDDFNPNKISLAIERCFKNGLGWSDDEAATATAKVLKSVVNILNKKAGATHDVEDIQKVIIQQLWARGYDDAATQYTLFKEQRRSQRLETPVEPALRKMVEDDAKYFPSALQYYQFVSKFAKWNEELGRRETWGECVDRVIGFFEKHEFYKKLSDKDKKDLKEHLHKMEATPAMRVIQMAGPALDRCNVGVYNCSYLTISDIKSFSELLYILMQGTGAGFSVERQYVNQLPPVRRQTGKTPKKLTIIDDTEGWCDALDAGLKAWFNGEDIEFDYSTIRPAGTRLKTKGGRASGPGPLMELMDFAKNLILSRQGQSLTDIDCHDLACKVGKIVQVGGVRRASEISLSDLNSVEMRNAKAGSWWTNNLQRTMANNSAVYTSKPSTIEFIEEWLALAKSGSGERGIFNRDGVNRSLPTRRKPWTFGTNPCAEIILRPYQFCNLSIVVARENDTAETLAKKVRIATIFGTMQSCLTNFKYIRNEWKSNCEEERLLGVDITGQMDCPILRPGAKGRS
jgi:ribonucleoside-triphosphate reductase